MTTNLKKYFQTIFRWFREIFNTPKDNFVSSHQFELYSAALERPVLVEVLLPPGFSQAHPQGYPLVLFNDGQDFEALQMKTTLEDLYQKGRLSRKLIVGIHAADRMQEYGTIQPKDYLNRGAKAKAYTEFIIDELLPHLYQHFPCKRSAKDQSIAGFSLGGLSAFDIAWNHPEQFGQVGIFSGSLWWRSADFNPNEPDADRIAHYLIEKGPIRQGMRFWLQTGTKDETSDRNNNGIIDAIDDTLDLIKALKALGYSEKDIQYLEVEGGEHNPQTWGKVMDQFLCWI